MKILDNEKLKFSVLSILSVFLIFSAFLWNSCNLEKDTNSNDYNILQPKQEKGFYRNEIHQMISSSEFLEYAQALIKYQKKSSKQFQMI